MKMFSRLSLAGLSLVIALAAVGHLQAADPAEKPIKALLLIGGCCHDYTKQKSLITEGISARANVEWTVVHEGDGKTTHPMSVFEVPIGRKALMS